MIKEKYKEEKGITLIALVITVIVLLILAGVGIGATTGTNGSVKTSSSNTALAELSQVQQVVLETYIKSQQTHNEDYLIGEKKKYDEAAEELKNIDSSLELKGNSESTYYKLTPDDLDELGIKGATDTYIVNYSTGEVFNITTTHTAEGEVLYIYE